MIKKFFFLHINKKSMMSNSQSDFVSIIVNQSSKA
jgi:hypothetical protein